MTSNIPPELLEGEESSIDVFEEAVAKAEKLGRLWLQPRCQRKHPRMQ